MGIGKSYAIQILPMRPTFVCSFLIRQIEARTDQHQNEDNSYHWGRRGQSDYRGDMGLSILTATFSFFKQIQSKHGRNVSFDRIGGWVHGC